MLMPLVASLLAPAMLAASTFTNVVGTVQEDPETIESSGVVASSFVVATPSESFEDLDFVTVDFASYINLGSFDTLEMANECYGGYVWYDSASGELRSDYFSTDPTLTDANLVVIPSSLPFFYLNVSDAGSWSNVANNYKVAWVFAAGIDYAYYLPAGSYDFDEGYVSFDVDALTSTVSGTDIISAVGGGLNVVPHLGGSLNDGFDAVFINNGALTVVGLFAFTLMGLGIGVGVVKKVLNWITGRHGM